MHRVLARAAGLSDLDLLRHVSVLAKSEREATIELVGHLAELDTRKLHRAEGYGSLFAYCTGALRLAEHAAYNRIEAARLARRFPATLDLLADGSLNLSTARLLSPHLRPDNFERLAAQARGRSKREVEALVACLQPRPDAATLVRRLPAPAAAAPSPSLAMPAGLGLEPQPGAGPPSLAPLDGYPSTTVPPAPEREALRPTVTPLAPERYRVQFTIGVATHEKLRRAQDLLRREIPDADPGAIFDRALTLLLDDVARRKLAATAKPRALAGRPARSRHIPAPVKRAVWVRDGGRCAFVAGSGRRCKERSFLELHHREPYALGGEATVANISLRCWAHNVYEAELAFGPRTRPGASYPLETRLVLQASKPDPDAAELDPRGERGLHREVDAPSLVADLLDATHAAPAEERCHLPTHR